MQSRAEVYFDTGPGTGMPVVSFSSCNYDNARTSREQGYLKAKGGSSLFVSIVLKCLVKLKWPIQHPATDICRTRSRYQVHAQSNGQTE